MIQDRADHRRVARDRSRLAKDVSKFHDDSILKINDVAGEVVPAVMGASYSTKPREQIQPTGRLHLTVSRSQQDPRESDITSSVRLSL